MQATKIKDIYAGKPDAKDEINTSGLEDFVKSFVVPYNFDVDRLDSVDKRIMI